MVKCDNCGNKNLEKYTPAVCEKCGHIMKPVLVVREYKRPKKRKVQVEEKTLEILED